MKISPSGAAVRIIGTGRADLDTTSKWGDRSQCECWTVMEQHLFFFFLGAQTLLCAVSTNTFKKIYCNFCSLIERDVLTFLLFHSYLSRLSCFKHGQTRTKLAVLGMRRIVSEVCSRRLILLFVIVQASALHYCFSKNTFSFHSSNTLLMMLCAHSWLLLSHSYRSSGQSLRWQGVGSSSPPTSDPPGPGVTRAPRLPSELDTE